MQIYCKITNGKIPHEERELIKQELQKLEGKMARIVIDRKRTNQQNSYWFGMLNDYVVPIWRETGENWCDWSVHEALMKEMGYTHTMVTPLGEVHAIREHSSGFNTIQWEEFMNRARAHLATVHGIFMPLPEKKGSNNEKPINEKS